MIFVVAIAPEESRFAWLDAVLIEPAIPSNLFGSMPVRPPAKVSALQDDVRLLFIDELVQSSEICVEIT
jgi:hypothetical protein